MLHVFTIYVHSRDKEKFLCILSELQFSQSSRF